ncbi:MAG: hypothetical protein BZ137_08620 [Methanosphaera sp. rholeuAM130]|nr:MAG: hypothetical protein BZ137_08620 [Methanosphaera sp. rholeuAM130]
MKEKLKNIIIPFSLMMIFNLGYYYLTGAPNFGEELNPHLGILFISGLFFGPYGTLGAVIANFICDIIRGYSTSAIASAIISFIISYLAYKLWYTKDSEKYLVTKPRLNNSYNLIYLFIIVIECAILYSVLAINLTELFYPNVIGINYHVGLQYFTNFVNFAILSSIICILISEFKEFSYTPTLSKKQSNNNKYKLLYQSIVIFTAANILLYYIHSNYMIILIITAILVMLLILYIRKPITMINKIEYVSIPEKIMNYFVSLTLIVLIIDIILAFTPLGDMMTEVMFIIATNQPYLIMLLILDSIIILFFIPALILLRFIEDKIIYPIRSFSKIESFIKKDKKIESEGILKLYSEYINQDDEIGILSRSYTDLINYNNEYIENMKKLESEKERIKTELNIAHNIQQATLPKNILDDEYINIEGYCKAAKEVGGDFYDYYRIDEDNTMIIIGDASGKGIPAAIFTIITQNSIKLLIKNEMNPAKVLTDVNNQICENNPEMMFITLFLAIYNNKTHRLTYANAGHNPPIIKNNDNYELLNLDSEIVLGVMDNYEYKNHELLLQDEIILYTDGITDAQNENKELYGEERFIEVLNNHETNDLINEIISDINGFTKEEEQFDDMTLLILKVKK